MEKIVQLTEAFNAQVLGDDCPRKLCFTICVPLHFHLTHHGVENTLRTGECENMRHYWIKLEDDKSTIIDPTIRQFDFARKMPLVYFGQKPTEFMEEKEGEDWFSEPFDNYLNPFEFPSAYSELNLQILLKVNIKAAILINNEIEQMNLDISTSAKHIKYFSVINDILINYVNNNQYLEFSKLQGFDNLVSKAYGNIKA